MSASFPIPAHLTAEERRVWDAAAAIFAGTGRPVPDPALAERLGVTVWGVRAIIAPLRSARSWPFGRTQDLVERAPNFEPDEAEIALAKAEERRAGLAELGIRLQERRPDLKGPRVDPPAKVCRRLLREWRRGGGRCKAVST